MSYDVGQVCLNGHPINGYSRTQPGNNKKFCDQCGEKTITQCPKCKNEIQGRFLDFPDFNAYAPPAYCKECGTAFPWTEIRIQTTIEMIKETGHFNQDEVKSLEENVNEIVKNSPRTMLAANKFKKILTKVGTETAQAVRDVVVDIVSETAKKIIWPE